MTANLLESVLLPLLTVISCQPAIVLCQQFMLTKLASPVSATFKSLSMASCVAKCENVSGCSAVSYSQFRMLCVISTCGNLIIANNALWDTTVVLQTVLKEKCDLPAARIEWMLTDTCGSSNSGYLSAPVAMQPQSSLRVLGAPALPTSYFGKAYVGATSNTGSCWASELSSALDYDFTKSFTMFAYVYMSDMYTYYPIMDFRFNNSAGNTQGPHFWSYSGGVLYYNVPCSSGFQCTENGINRTGSVLKQNCWIHVALAYNEASASILMYNNGESYGPYILGTPVKKMSQFNWAVQH